MKSLFGYIFVLYIAIGFYGTAGLKLKRTENCRQFSITALASLEELPNANSPKIKLPVVQFYHQKQLVSEFICGNDVLGSYGRIQATLKQFQRDSAPQQSISSQYVSTIYDDSQLHDEIASSNMLALKIYRIGCKKCMQFEPLYIDLAENPLYHNIKWFQADVEYIPKHVGILKERLLGGTKSSIENCSNCNNTGFVSCPECNAMGIVTRGANSVICPTCVGYKKIRCPKCGGKCLKCEEGDNFMNI